MHEWSENSFVEKTFGFCAGFVEMSCKSIERQKTKT